VKRNVYHVILRLRQIEEAPEAVGELVDKW